MPEFRPARPDDEPEIHRLVGMTLGWDVDERFARFFRWKHRENPFGPSNAWVAIDAGEVVGFRTFLRWEFVDRGRVFRAVRAVDTATHPDHQGKGIFTKLTSAALEDEWSRGTDFVFNTPNHRSRPGYLKMGWQIVGRLPVAVRPRSPRVLGQLAHARMPAALWSTPSEAGTPAGDVVAEKASLEHLLGVQPPDVGLRTARTTDYLAWRYGLEDLQYRAVTCDGGVENGVAFFRLRRRGPLAEAVVCDVLVPGGTGRMIRSLLSRIARVSGADYTVVLGGWPRALRGFVPIPRSGPILMWRGHQPRSAAPQRWSLELGDIELF